MSADVTEDGRVSSGTARARGRREVAPVTRVQGGVEVKTGAGGPATVDQVNVGWLCPFCGRNTLRVFDLGAVTFRERDRAPSELEPAE